MKDAIAARIEIWDESIAAFYFALPGVHLLSSICFAIATWDRDDKWKWFVATGFLANAIESAARVGEGYLGQTWLSGPSNATYFPVEFLSFGTLGLWLWRQTQAISGGGAGISPA